VIINIQVFWVVTLCLCFRGAYPFHLKGLEVLESHVTFQKTLIFPVVVFMLCVSVNPTGTCVFYVTNKMELNLYNALYYY